MKLDRFYTPPQLAEKMISYANGGEKLYIADFASGDGELLRAGRKRCPKSQFVATDICRNSVSLLRRSESSWRIGQCDFVNSASRNRCIVLNEVKGKVSLVLLNPPFSCRGGSFFFVEINENKIRCSLALSFLINSIQYLAPGGQVVAILPASCLNSEKDKLAWKTLCEIGQTDILDTNGHKTFSGCFAKTVIVRFTASVSKSLHYKKPTPSYGLQAINAFYSCVKIIRGKVQMHSFVWETSKQWLPLVHTTELQKDGVNLLNRRINVRQQGICGPVVLIPRVGKPSKFKILLYKGKRPIVLSDCVIALKPKTVSDAQKIQSVLLNHWSTVEKYYGGTCANYININDLSQLLTNLGFKVVL